jgi:adenylate cyclase
MPQEIERKFLLKSDAWRTAAVRRERMSQGYIAGNDRASVRVRVAGDAAALNIKSGGLVASRKEYEYAIPLDEAVELLALCSRPLIDKTRHFVPYGGSTTRRRSFRVPPGSASRSRASRVITTCV